MAKETLSGETSSGETPSGKNAPKETLAKDALAKTSPAGKTSPAAPAPTHFRSCCRNVIQVLEKTGVSTPELDARLLISNALGLRGAAFFLEPDRLLSELELNEIAQRLARRMAGEPVSRIVGERGFWKHEFRINPDVLDPRPDSETLIEAAIDLLNERQSAWMNQEGRPAILDLGTGSGALLISLLLEFPEARGVGIDVSPEALEVAILNAERLGCADRAEFLVQNWLDGMGENGGHRFDLVISNPPYIPHKDIAGLAAEVARFDPHGALDGGEDGLDPYREMLPQLSKVLTPDGIVIFEIGEGQHKPVRQLLDDAGFEAIGGSNGCYKDLGGHIRALAASYNDHSVLSE